MDSKIILKKGKVALKKYERLASRRTLTERERIKYCLLKIRFGNPTYEDSNYLLLKQQQYGTLDLNQIDYLTR
jgi:hypothetical protein